MNEQNQNEKLVIEGSQLETLRKLVKDFRQLTSISCDMTLGLSDLSKKLSDFNDAKESIKDLAYAAQNRITRILLDIMKQEGIISHDIFD